MLARAKTLRELTVLHGAGRVAAAAMASTSGLAPFTTGRPIEGGPVRKGHEGDQRQTMYRTLEVRWFTQGELPRSVKTWFRSFDSEPEMQARRIDYYFPISGVDSIGIKVREGRIELKQREQQLGVVRFCERVHGVLEKWHKWSIGLAETDASLAALGVPGCGWIGIEKLRVVRVFAFKQGELSAVRPGEYPSHGCAWELTQLSIAGRSWWSLGLEAFGADDGLDETLARVSRYVLAEHGPLTLAAEDSFGYPALLDRLDKRFKDPRRCIDGD